MSARLSRWPFTYTFQVSPGQMFIRLHFYPASYRGGFERSKAFFTVKAGPYTLLSNFSASLTADALGLESVVKEYCVNVEENQPLILTLSPTLGGSSDEAYAFVNGIEIVSMPTGLYHTREGDAGAHVVGENYRFPVGKSIALEMVQRLNAGGSSISSIEDTGMFRDWSQDSYSFMQKPNVQPVTTTLRIKYTSIPSYTAPHKVYQTYWSMVKDKQGNGTLNFAWKFPIDLGFRYLLRLHFCDFEYEIEESDRTKFSIFVNEHVAEAKADIVKWSGGNRVAVYRDYVVMMEGDRKQGKHDLLIAYFPHNHEWTEQIDTILKGLEVFKMSNPDKNLAGVNPAPLSCASTSSNTKPRKFVYASGGNAIATVLVILLTTTNISVYMLRVWGEKFNEKNISPLQPERLCRRFSLSKVLSVTNNFNDEFVIGRGGFGNVYKALIDDGRTIVAIKRLNSNSKQGADEFWTEIEMLSKLRHTHLVSLIGYCDEQQEMILVYEYMENGTLADHLYKHYTFGNGTICNTSWKQRMKACIGAARGLDYLHTGTRRGIIHRDVKATNILLDRDWVAKISDFGLCKEGTTCRLCDKGTTCHSHTYHVSTMVKGTFGYLDPEYFLTRRLTKKSDVYAFGVVLLEVLCGRPALDLSVEEEQRCLAMWAQQCIKEEKHDQLIDPSLRDQISPQCLKVFIEVANKCLHKHPSGRPTMTDVVASLECMLASLEQPRNASTEEEDFNVHGDSDQQIYDDKNTQQNDILPQSTVASLSTPVQFNENTQRQKKSKKNLFQRGIAFLARSIDIRSMNISDVEIHTTAANKISDVEIQTTTANEISDVEIQTTTANEISYVAIQTSAANKIIFQGMSLTTNTTPSNESISGNWQILPSPTLRIFSSSELRYATNRWLGEGRFGKVYRGRVDEKVTSYNVTGFDVAMKKLDYQRIQRFKNWQSVVGFLGGLSNSNLVKLLGYCWEGEVLLLVYEFMPEGSLEKHLLGWGSPVLPWIIRVKILIGAARGLAFLHASETPVICKDFRTSNILLDGSFNSKISDFGYADFDDTESFCGYVPTVWPGTVWPGIVRPGKYCDEYIALEYFATGHLDVRSDVYSFGVVLLEMLTGSRAYDPNRPRAQRNLVDWVKHYLADGKELAGVMDSSLEGEYPPQAAQRLALLALQCLQVFPKERPSMEQVAETLEHINLLSSNSAGTEGFKAQATDKHKVGLVRRNASVHSRTTS